MNSISLNQENRTSLQQQQQLLVNLAMKQAFHVLQLPALELAEWLNNEIESNPILEVDLTKETFKERLSFRDKSQEKIEKGRKEHQENMLIAPVSLYEHMMAQAPLFFEERGDLHVAELLIGHLNEKGFLDTPLHEIAPAIPLSRIQSILKTLQTFDPPGIAARDLRECLLIQLDHKQKSHSHAYKVIAEHFDELLYNRLPILCKKLNIPIGELTQIVRNEIAPLDLHPGYKFCSQPSGAIIPDLIFLCMEDKWQIEVNTRFFPKFRVATIYTEAIRKNTAENEEYFYLRRQLAGGRWLKKIVQRRNSTLQKIGEIVLKKQMAFFNGDKAGLLSMSIKEAAEELGLHESTVARAITDKFIACPLGMFSLRSFFQQGVETNTGKKISNHSLRAILSKTINEEDKLHPLSDQQLVYHFRKLGIPCARRTIAKYRSSLKVAPACKRRRWSVV